MSRFAAVPTAALDDERLEALHIRVLTALCSFSDKDGWCRVGQDKIAARARTNPARVSSSLSALAEWGWVRKQRVGKQKVNVYQVVMDRAIDQSLDLPPEQDADTANHQNCRPSKSSLPTEQITIAPPANPIGTPLSNTPSSASSLAARQNAMMRILDACGPGMIDQSKSASPVLDLKARIDRWLAAYDLEEEILPVVEAKTKHLRTPPMSHFRFIEEDIAKFHAKRVQPLPQPELVHEGNVQGRGAGPAYAGGSGAGRYGSGNGSPRSGFEPRSGNLAAAAARRRAMREDEAVVSDEPEDWRDDGMAGGVSRHGTYLGR